MKKGEEGKDFFDIFSRRHTHPYGERKNVKKILRFEAFFHFMLFLLPNLGLKSRSNI